VQFYDEALKTIFYACLGMVKTCRPLQHLSTLPLLMLKSIRTLPIVQSWKLLDFEKTVFIGLKQVFLCEVFLEKAKNRYFFVGVILEFERMIADNRQ